MTRAKIFTLTMAAATTMVAFGANAQTYETSRVPGSASQEVVREQRVQENRAPGNTRELAPDTKETATGGQPGGVTGRN